MFLSDFHIHSTFSDGKLSIPELVDLYGQRGFGAIAITDHLCEEEGFIGKTAAYLGKTLTRASFPLYQEILKSEKKRAWETYGMLLIPGYEVTKNSLLNHKAAHVVALGATEWVSADQDLKQIARSIRDAGGMAVAAHPLSPQVWKNRPYYLWDRRGELKDEFDAWEVTFHDHLLKEVIESDLPKLASSDLHRPEQIRSWKTSFSCARDWQKICQSIRHQDLSIQFYRGEEGLDRRSVSGRMGIDLFTRPLGNLARV